MVYIYVWHIYVGHKSSTRDMNMCHYSAEALLMSAEVDVEEIEGDEEEEAIQLTASEIYKKAGLTLLAGAALVCGLFCRSYLVVNRSLV